MILAKSAKTLTLTPERGVQWPKFRYRNSLRTSWSTRSAQRRRPLSCCLICRSTRPVRVRRRRRLRTPSPPMAPTATVSCRPFWPPKRRGSSGTASKWTTSKWMASKWTAPDTGSALLIGKTLCVSALRACAYDGDP